MELYVWVLLGCLMLWGIFVTVACFRRDKELEREKVMTARLGDRINEWRKKYNEAMKDRGCDEDRLRWLLNYLERLKDSSMEYYIRACKEIEKELGIGQDKAKGEAVEDDRTDALRYSCPGFSGIRDVAQGKKKTAEDVLMPGVLKFAIDILNLYEVNGQLLGRVDASDLGPMPKFNFAHDLSFYDKPESFIQKMVQTIGHNKFYLLVPPKLTEAGNIYTRIYLVT